MNKHLHREIVNLKTMILSLGTLVETGLKRAIKSTEDNNQELALEVIADDAKIDEMEIEVEEECLKLLALYQPVASNLRFIAATLMINSDLERIGDIAANIAQIPASGIMSNGESLSYSFNGIYKKCQLMLKHSLDALVELNTDLAKEVCSSDDEVDEMYRDFNLKIQSEIIKYPERSNYLLNLLTIYQNLERVADHATNIAEDVIYMTEGKIIRHSNEQFSSE